MFHLTTLKLVLFSSNINNFALILQNNYNKKCIINILSLIFKDLYRKQDEKSRLSTIQITIYYDNQPIKSTTAFIKDQNNKPTYVNFHKQEFIK